MHIIQQPLVKVTADQENKKALELHQARLHRHFVQFPCLQGMEAYEWRGEATRGFSPV